MTRTNTATIGAITIRLTPLPTGPVRLDTTHAGSSIVIDELTRTYPTDEAARAAARDLYRAFATGVSVQDYLHPELKEMAA